VSYHAKPFTSPLWVIVSSLSKMDENELPMMSVDTSGSSVYWRIPSKPPLSATSRKRPLTSSTVTSFARCTVRSTREPSGTGARMATPSTFPFNSGMTRPMARAAPVEVGMRLIAAERARLRSECGRSRIRWSFVYA